MFAASPVLIVTSLIAWSPQALGHIFPRPPWKESAKMARWLVHESDYAVASTTCSSVRMGCAFKGQATGDIMSLSDGDGVAHSTGIVYTYLPDLEDSAKDVAAEPAMTFTFSEKALGCNTTAEDPPCGRLTIAGKLTQVPEGTLSKTAEKYLFSRHPQMKAWGGAHNFKAYWMAKENISSFFMIDMYGGAAPISIEEYFAASPGASTIYA
mmetsp:Transcript_124674/g.248869  ORF Transcript_124674/g.248869 Transcript_124674/m.248869 type:complete len:210 (-) Transcript_124674:141-770(-)